MTTRLGNEPLPPQQCRAGQCNAKLKTTAGYHEDDKQPSRKQNHALQLDLIAAKTMLQPKHTG